MPPRGATWNSNIVITSYSIHYTKLYDLLDGFRRQLEPYLARPEFAARLTEHLRRQAERSLRATGYA